jgi:hypothetical protein
MMNEYHSDKNRMQVIGESDTIEHLSMYLEEVKYFCTEGRFGIQSWYLIDEGVFLYQGRHVTRGSSLAHA